MTGIKPSSHGIVVDHKESGTRYAISDKNYSEKVHRKVRDLLPGETVIGYRPKRRDSSEGALGAEGGTSTPDGAAKSERSGSEPLTDASAGSGKATRAEGSASAGTKG